MKKGFVNCSKPEVTPVWLSPLPPFSRGIIACHWWEAVSAFLVEGGT